MLTTREEPPLSAEDDSGARVLFPEARQRERRRRLIWSLVMVGIAAAGTGAGIVVAGGGSRKPPAVALRLIPPSRSAAPPTVDASAFSRQGDLAFISEDDLWVLDGSTKSVAEVAVPNGFVPADPMFSPDHKWLAYVATPFGFGSSSELCVATADGGDARVVADLTGAEEGARAVFGWNPRRDVIAFEVGDPMGVGVVPVNGNRFEKYDYGVWVWSPGTAPRKITSAPEITLATWSPDGSQLAVGADTGAFTAAFGSGGFTSSVTSYSLDGRAPTVWLRDHTSKGSQNYQFLVPVGWWPRWGIGYYALGSAYGAFNGSAWDDGLAISVIGRPGASPRSLGVRVLLSGATTPIAASTRTGQLALSSNSMGARPIWTNESVELCSPSSQVCSKVQTPAGTVSLNAVWSPSGSKLAYAVAKDLGSDEIVRVNVQGWYDDFQLRILDTRTGRTSAIDGLEGSAVPAWSADGRGLLVVRDNAIWLWSGHGAPVQVAGPLTPPVPFYGQVDWSGQFAWSQSPTPSL